MSLADPGVPRRLVFLTQLLDVDDPALGFVANWCASLAASVEELTVMANEVRSVPARAPYSVVSLGKEHGAGRRERTQRLRRAMRAQQHPVAVLGHMCPIYLVVAATTRSGRRARSALWYAHPSVTPELRVAHRVADVVLTSLPGAYPLDGSKVRTIGQATDVTAFVRVPPPVNGPRLRMVALGRTSPYKGHQIMVEAVQRVVATGHDVALDIIGPSMTAAEHRHRHVLEQMAIEPALHGRVRVLPAVAPAALPEVLRGYDAMVNATEDGSGDKAVFEALAAGRPVVATNSSFGRLFDEAGCRHLLRARDAADLAAGIEALVATGAAARAAQGSRLAKVVQRDHALATFGERVWQAIWSEADRPHKSRTSS